MPNTGVPGDVGATPPSASSASRRTGVEPAGRHRPAGGGGPAWWPGWRDGTASRPAHRRGAGDAPRRAGRHGGHEGRGTSTPGAGRSTASPSPTRPGPSAAACWRDCCTSERRAGTMGASDSLRRRPRVPGGGPYRPAAGV
ncbi:MAG: hypothetical protein ACLRWQ_01515 [Flavonifractor plautii]